MLPSLLAQYALYAASAISAASIAGHTQMGYEVVLPSLKRLVAGKKEDDGTVAAKIGWWEVNQVFGVMGTFSLLVFPFLPFVLFHYHFFSPPFH
jgi:hypothetical protein